MLAIAMNQQVDTITTILGGFSPAAIVCSTECSQPLESASSDAQIRCYAAAGDFLHMQDASSRAPHYEPDMNQLHELKLAATIAPNLSSVATLTTRLTTEQLGALCRCARGLSLRFEAWSIINPLVNGGYAEKDLGGGVRLTAKGKRYIRMNTLQDMP